MTTKTPTPRTDRPPAPGALRLVPAAPDVPDLSAASRAIAGGARLSVGPSGGVATRAPVGVRGDEARRFIDDARRVLHPVTGDAAARAALLAILRPWPHGWGDGRGCDLVRLLWSDALASIAGPLPLRPGVVAADVPRFLRSMRRAVIAGPTWHDARGIVRWAARHYTGALAADLNAIAAAHARVGTRHEAPAADA